MIINQVNIRDAGILGLIALAGFSLFLGAPPLFDWDEINFAEAAREMIVSGNYLQVQINFEPFYEKPPLFFWLQVLAMKIFGVNEFAARFPNAIIGVFTVLALYFRGLYFRDRFFGYILAGFYLGTMLPVIYFKTGIIDPTFNFFIFLGLMQILRFDFLHQKDRQQARKDSGPWGAGFWIGLATLTKGPVALLVTGLIYLIYKILFDRLRFPWMAMLTFLMAWAIVVAGWYGIETVVHGPTFINAFVNYQIELFNQNVAGHEQPFYYHFFVFVLGCFPMAAFTFRGMFLSSGIEQEKMLRRFMMVWFWVVLILFSVVRTKIVHYSSLLYFPGAFLAADFFYELKKGNQKLKWDNYLLLTIGILVWGGVPTSINYVENNLPQISAMIQDSFTKANLTAEVNWSGLEWMIGGFFLAGMIVNMILLVKKKWNLYLYLQVALTLFFVNAQFKVNVPKVARYTQGAPLDFFSGLAKKDVYIVIAGYKSYLPYFYARVNPHQDDRHQDIQWLVQGDIDKDVYLVVKEHKINPAFKKRFRNFEELYRSAGFVFFVRKSNKVLRANQTIKQKLDTGGS
jgi:4-amino-4-deoxy-L-arabinose transferase-like glycosyltransferase